MLYKIKYTPCPTWHNRSVTVETEDLNEFVEFRDGDLKMHERFGWVRVESVTLETHDKVLVHYEYRGFSTPHISDHLKLVVRQVKPRVLA